MFDLIIIGGGPAGVTAGIYASRKKLNTLLITKDFFGQIAKTGQVDNWPGDMAISGMALAMKLEKHLRQFSIEIKTGQKVVSVTLSPHPSALGPRSGAGDQGGVEVQTDTGEKHQAKALIITTGRNARTLGIAREDEFVGKGLSYCSICDAPFFRDKQVAVIGGGNAGFETALDLAKYAKEVFIFEKADKVYADELLVETLRLRSGQAGLGRVKICLQAEIISIEGQGKVQSIIYRDLASGKEMQQPMEGIFVQIGSVPATLFLGKLVEFNEKNEIKVNPSSFEASTKGIFAAGDCNDTKYKQAIIASGQGAVAALAAYEYLQNS